MSASTSTDAAASQGQGSPAGGHAGPIGHYTNVMTNAAAGPVVANAGGQQQQPLPSYHYQPPGDSLAAFAPPSAWLFAAPDPGPTSQQAHPPAAHPHSAYALFAPPTPGQALQMQQQQNQQTVWPPAQAPAQAQWSSQAPQAPQADEPGLPAPPNPPAAGATPAGGSGIGSGYTHVHMHTHTHTHTHTHIHAHSHATHALVHTQVHHHHPGNGFGTGGFGFGFGPGPGPSAGAEDYTMGALAQMAAGVLSSGSAPSGGPLLSILSQFQLLLPNTPSAPNNLVSQNTGFKDFLELYSRGLASARMNLRPTDLLSSNAIAAQMNSPLRHITQDKIDGDRCDIQGVDWTKLGMPRYAARSQRKVSFQNFVSIPRSDRWKPSASEKMLSSHETYFRFRRMHVKQGIFLPHFQLRNLLACNSRTQAYYADRGGVVQLFNPLTGLSKPVMRFKKQSSVVLSTIASGQSMLVAGGFSGEYCVANMDSEYLDEAPFENCFEGAAIGGNGGDSDVDDNTSGITNHIEVHSLRNAAGPLAAFASNDKGLRILDLETQKVLSTVMFDFAPNCTAISPDRRLRVVVGDQLNALIVAAEPERSIGGKAPDIQQELSGHRDYGFSCAWAPDGYTLATGNQDRAIKIWDARKWCDAAGKSTPVITVRTKMSGARSLHFSPAGSGSRLLVVGEEADFVTMINAQTFREQQAVDMFGELAGVALTDDGEDLFALCADPWRGGVVQFERCSVGAHVDDDHLEEAFRPYSSRRWRRNSTGPPDWSPIGSGDCQGGSATAATTAALAQQARRQQQRLARRRQRAASRAGLDVF